MLFQINLPLRRVVQYLMGRLGSGLYSHSLGQSGQDYWSGHRITPFQGFLIWWYRSFLHRAAPYVHGSSPFRAKVERIRRTAICWGVDRGPKAPKGQDILTMGDAHRTGSNQMASPERASYFSGTTALFKGSIPRI